MAYYWRVLIMGVSMGLKRFTCFVIAVLLCTQVSSQSSVHCEMELMPAQSPVAMDHHSINLDSMDHSAMEHRGTAKNISTSHDMMSMSADEDCCEGNCYCPNGTGYSLAIVTLELLTSLKLPQDQVSIGKFIALEAHNISIIKPPIFG